MDIFIEKIVQKRKDMKDYLIIVGIALAALILMLLVLNYIPGMTFIFIIVISCRISAYYSEAWIWIRRNKWWVWILIRVYPAPNVKNI